jgi:hypothetical protein
MICDDLELRLYDEDCRRALIGTAPMPEDVADHVAGCSACRKTWAEAARDTVRLTRDLQLAPPPSLVRRAAAVALQPPARPLLGWYDLGVAVIAGAVFVVVATLVPGADLLWQSAAFWTGAAGGFAASVIDRSLLLPSLGLRS